MHEELVSGLARVVVERAAPEELPVLPEVVAASTGGRSGWRRPGGSVGFGVDDALVSAIAVQAATSAVAEVLGWGAAAARTGWRGWLRRRGGRARATDPAPLRLTPEQVGEVRAACREQAEALGVPADAARLLADAVVGRLTDPPATR